MLLRFRCRTKKYKVFVSSIIIIFIINNLLFFAKVFSPEFIFSNYTKGYFSFITSIQHIVFRVFPFSVGDVFYIAIAVVFIYFFIKFIISFFKPKYDIFLIIIDTITFAIIIWLIIAIQWNWNYSQPRLEDKLNMNTDKYEISELVDFTEALISKTIDSKKKSNFDIFDSEIDAIIEISTLGYDKMAKIDDFFTYNSTSIKTSLFSPILPYLGISGYYNPFTAEAQITKGIPSIQIPFVVNHEVAHQLGIASESEANFIGYLASINNPIEAIQYSGNLNLLLYCLHDLKNHKSNKYGEIVKLIPDDILNDIKQISKYWFSYNNKYKKYSNKGYDIFLKSNHQKNGIKSYSKIVSLAIFYFRKKDDAKFTFQ